MWHTLQEAIKLTGRSRRSLYRDMDAGRVSYRVRDDGRRELETSELLRAYGPLAHLAQPEPEKMAQVGTPDSTLLDEIRLLREEVAALRSELRLIEHKPAPKTATSSGGKVKTFADLVARFNGNDDNNGKQG